MALAGALVATCPAALWARGESSFARTIDGTQPKIVKIFGAGGLRGLEPYQSGFLISADGHVLTVWSYVLDTDYIAVVLHDGRKFEAKLVGADPRLELAVLKIDATDLDHFDLAQSAEADTGTRVLAFSNLFGVATGDEPASVQHGSIAVRTRLDARRGAAESPYHGPVYVVDAMTNNPGAAGGALTDQRGRLLAMLGKEMRNSLNNTWLNYALPIDQLSLSVADIVAGKSRALEDSPLPTHGGIDLAQFGLVLVPDVLERTPPFVDEVRAGSPAAQAGVQRDDLVVFVGDQLVQSCKNLTDELARVEPGTQVRIVLMRGQELVDIVLAPSEKPTPTPTSTTKP